MNPENANAVFQPAEKVLIVFDDYNENDKMKAIRPMHEGEIIELQELHPEAVCGSTHTYSAVVIEFAVYVIQWRRRLFRIQPFDENPTWLYLQGPNKFHGAEPPAVTLDGWIFVCGGGFEEVEVYRQTNEKLPKMTKACEKYNPVVGQWEMFKDMQYEKRLNAMVEASGYIYSIGGIGRENDFEDTKANIKQENTALADSREVALSLVESYDKESDEWSIMPPMRESRIAPAVASYNGRIYVLGGGGVDGESLRLPVNHGDRLFRRSVEFFDIYTNEWVLAKKGMASPRIKFRACVFDDKIYAVGGNKDSNNNVEQANIQDIRGEGDVVGQGAKVWNVAEWIGEMSEWNYMATLLMNVPTEQMQVD